MGLFSELRRRNVYRMAVLYAVTSWLIMQAAEVVMTLASLPEWTGQLTLILLAIGFPIALVLSWFYELTPEGISLEKDIKPGESITHLTGRRLDFIVIALLCAGLLVFAYDKWWMSGPPITSIAVLPLEILSDDPEQGYFADGMTEVLTAQLAQIDNLRVISRTSAMHYKNTELSLPEISLELGADAIVEGSIQPAGDEVRFTMQLIDGRTDKHLWSKSYLRKLKDVLTLQGKIAREISGEIEIILTPQSDARLARDRSVDPDALQLWLIGRHHLRGHQEESYVKALRAFEAAAERDPEFAEAYAGIAHTYTNFGGWFGAREPETVLPLAKKAARKALQLDPDLANGHIAMAEIHRLEWSWEAAEREFRIGWELNPSDAGGFVGYANMLAAMGRFDEALDIARQGARLDPLSPGAHNEFGMALWFAGQHDAALRQHNYALQLDPDFFQTQWILSEFFIFAGEYDKALPYLEKLGQKIDTLPPVMIGLAAGQYARVGQRDRAREILSDLLERKETELIRGSVFAYVFLGLEEYDETIGWLEVAYEQRDVSLIWLRADPLFDGLRSDPRFQDLVARMNFPETN